MRVLALDTTRTVSSVALVEDMRIVAERGEGSRAHAERLPSDLLRLLSEAGVPLPAIDLFAVASGPGSFTGLRIGIATIQGLAFVARRPVVPVSAFEALAVAGSAGLGAGDVVAVWMNAHRGDVFSALYRVSDSADGVERLAEIEGPAVGDPDQTLARWASRFPAPRRFVGDGATAFATHLAGRGEIVDPPLLAGTIGLIATTRGRAGQTVDPAGVQPLYVRRPDAELAREALAKH